MCIWGGVAACTILLKALELGTGARCFSIEQARYLSFISAEALQVLSAESPSFIPNLLFSPFSYNVLKKLFYTSPHCSAFDLSQPKVFWCGKKLILGSLFINLLQISSASYPDQGDKAKFIPNNQINLESKA